MELTNLSLTEHWAVFVNNEVANGHYASTNDVVCDALRRLEEQNSKYSALQKHLAEGAYQAELGEFVDNFAMDALLMELDQEL